MRTVHGCQLTEAVATQTNACTGDINCIFLSFLMSLLSRRGTFLHCEFAKPTLSVPLLILSTVLNEFGCRGQLDV